MYLLIAGCVVNIILDPILIFGLLGFPALGVAGAAIATVIGQISALLLYIIVYRRNSYAVHISFKHLVFDKAIIRQIYSVGIPLYCYDAPAVYIDQCTKQYTYCIFRRFMSQFLGVLFQTSDFHLYACKRNRTGNASDHRVQLRRR